MNEILIPSVIETFNGTEQAINIINYNFLKKRTVYIGEVNDLSALSTVLQINYLAAKSSEPIKIIINSPGGSVTAGLAIYDAMKAAQCEIITVATGVAASMGAFLLSAGTKGKRYVTPSAKVMIHQPSAGTQGRVSDMEINVEHFIRVKQQLNSILAENTGKSEKQIKRDSERDFWLDANAAVEYGIADRIGQGDENDE
ncbi:MAG: ATP-dependent Clp protease proteolytic subunit [Clostridia bacterium]|nr:ATP-dependent Clp protease proteolytic subunit [Clostridia bacterium]